MKKILVIRFSSLGDVILSSAAVLNLKISFPDSHITFLTKERYRPIAASFDGVDEIAAFSDNGGTHELIRLILDLDDAGYDALVDLHGSPRSWWVRKTVSGGVKLVYPKRRAERVQIVRTHRIPQTWPHTVDLYNSCIEQMGGYSACKRPIIHTPALDGHSRQKLEELKASHGLVVIAPGAAHPNKQWPLERFAEVARKLSESHNVSIVWAVTASDAGSSRLVIDVPPEHLWELVDYPVGQLGAVIEKADLTIANDSGIAHLSSAVGTPVVAVFGPTHPALGFAPRGLFDQVVDVDEYCRPCSLHGKRPCFRKERFCFTRLLPDMVYSAACRILDERSRLKPAIFVDRDGTIVKDKNYLSDPDQLELLPGAAEALRYANEAGYRVVVLSNQSGVARGLFDIGAVDKVNQRFLSLLSSNGSTIDGLYFCPHHPQGVIPGYTMRCDCRKPAAGMAEEAARTLNIDLRRSVVVGDKQEDVNLGRVIGARSYLVRTGHGRDEEQRLNPASFTGRVDVVDDLNGAVQQITASFAQ
ncbi:MAG: HAD-IIIA family hydrolase [Candidatus Zixiibacteriota bacterium]